MSYTPPHTTDKYTLEPIKLNKPNALDFKDKLIDFSQQLEEIIPKFSDAEGDYTALYLVTPDAGASASVGFWSQAAELSPAFANPANFPYTLSNCAASVLSQTLNIRGPNYTICGNPGYLSPTMHLMLNELEDRTNNVQQGMILFLQLEPPTHCHGLYIRRSANTTSEVMTAEPDALRQTCLNYFDNYSDNT